MPQLTELEIEALLDQQHEAMQIEISATRHAQVERAFRQLAAASDAAREAVDDYLARLEEQL